MLPDELGDVGKNPEIGAKKLMGLPYQIILREVETLAGHQDRLKEWTDIAIAGAERFA